LQVAKPRPAGVGAFLVLMNPQPTPYDLNWRMFGIPVRVHASFWLLAAFFVWPLMKDGVQFCLIGIGCILISILVHELAHALMFKYFGVDSAIVCYSFGGLAIPTSPLRTRSQQIVVSLAGPFANFMLAGLIWGSNVKAEWALISDYTSVAYSILIYINIGWGILNLLPVYPFDGGQVSRQLWQISRPRNGIEISLKLSLGVAIALAIYSFACEYNVIPRGAVPGWLRLSLFTGILFAILAAANYQQLQYEQRSRNYYDDRDRWR
jgi:Zn-dependent protease